MERKRPRVFFGWWIALACAAMSAWNGGTMYYGFTAFFLPIIGEFGWTRAEFSVAFAINSAEGAFLSPVVGWLVDRFGARRPMIIGVVIAGASIIGLSTISALPHFYAFYLAAGIGFGIAFSAGPPALIANWFLRMRSRAMGLMLAGYGVSGALAPVLVALIAAFGWRTTLVIIGVLTWVICIPLSLLGRHHPEPYGLLPDGDLEPAGKPLESPAPMTSDPGGFTIGEALVTRSFWLLTFAFGISWLALNAMIVHFIPYLVSVGIAAEMAALGVTGMTLLSVVGRLTFGFLGDFHNKRYLIALCFSVQFLGTLIFAFISEPWHLIAFILILGPSYGGPIPLRLAILADYFGRRAFATLAGLAMAASVVGGVVSPVFAGWFFDVTGSYRIAFIILGVIAYLGAPAILLATPPPLPARIAAAEARRGD